MSNVNKRTSKHDEGDQLLLDYANINEYHFNKRPDMPTIHDIPEISATDMNDGARTMVFVFLLLFAIYTFLVGANFGRWSQ